MKVSEQWLREWVDPPLDVDAIAERLTLGGLEVGNIVPAAPSLAGVIVSEVIEVQAHPRADRLSLCRVSDGREVHQVVCGAPNVVPSMKTAYAAPGISLPGGRTIERARIRGVESSGMLCSAAELGLGEDASGILELPASALPGAQLTEVLGLDDAIIDIDLTPNRGDCFCIIGIARDLATLTDSPMKMPEVASVVAKSDVRFTVELADGDACPRYAGRVIEGLDPHGRTPLWMQERLRRSGVRCVHPLVDVTNYVMLEFGQPMHVFDCDKLEKRIIVRGANAGERLILLDGQELELDEGTLVITDESGPVALAGVMGGEMTAVSAVTTKVFLESAFFEPVRLAGVARRYRLHTDASTRFERGVDPTMQARAVERATALILEICGGSAGPCEVSDLGTTALPATIEFRPAAVERLLGVRVDEGRIEKIFESLEMKVERRGGTWQVSPPAFRFDIAMEEDLIEEVARVHGYDAIPCRIPPGAAAPAVPVRESTVEGSLRRCLTARGYFEAVTYSFIDRDLSRLFEPDVEPVLLENPISSDMSAMRRSLWPGLAVAARYNLNRQREDISLFEIGMVFRRDGGQLSQVHRISGVRCGRAVLQQWGEPLRDTDFYDLKQDVESLIKTLGLAGLKIEPGTHPALHPGQSARIMLRTENIGCLGALHPVIAQSIEVDKPLFLFEFSYNFGAAPSIPKFRPISKFPAVRRDINVIVDESVAATACLEAVREAAGEHLKDLQLFDVYRGQGIDKEKKSLTIGLLFQALSSTLVDDEVDSAMQRVFENLSNRVGGRLRE